MEDSKVPVWIKLLYKIWRNLPWCSVIKPFCKRFLVKFDMVIWHFSVSKVNSALKAPDIDLTKRSLSLNKKIKPQLYHVRSYNHMEIKLDKWFWYQCHYETHTGIWCTQFEIYIIILIEELQSFFFFSFLFFSWFLLTWNIQICHLKAKAHLQLQGRSQNKYCWPSF